MENEKQNTGGRPTLFRDEYCEQAYKLCLLGATDKELADFFNVTETTINNWKQDFPEFFESIKRGKPLADSTVAERLYQRAIGYSHPETKIATHEGAITDSKVFDKHYPPDATAAIFWLKNRQPDKWRDRKEVEQKNVDEFSSMSDDELDKQINELDKG